MNPTLDGFEKLKSTGTFLLADSHDAMASTKHQVLCNWGRTLKQSSAVHIQALVFSRRNSAGLLLVNFGF
jgi:hypothetical protein